MKHVISMAVASAVTLAGRASDLTNRPVAAEPFRSKELFSRLSAASHERMPG